jgi:hypothetical protein
MEDDIKKGLPERACDDIDWINLPTDREQWRGFVIIAMNFKDP